MFNFSTKTCDKSSNLNKITFQVCNIPMCCILVNRKKWQMRRGPAFPRTLIARQDKTQISLRICTVWSKSSLSAWIRFGSLVTHRVPCVDCSYCTDSQANLSLRWAHMRCRRKCCLKWESLKGTVSYMWIYDCFTQMKNNRAKMALYRSPYQINWPFVQEKKC